MLVEYLDTPIGAITLIVVAAALCGMFFRALVEVLCWSYALLMLFLKEIEK